MSKHWREVPKPPQVAALPVDQRGYPIFFTVSKQNDPIDIRVLDPVLIVEAGRRKLCSICGQALDYWVWFLGGPRDVAQRGFAEPPMHRACLDYAIAVCPYLSNTYEARVREDDPERFDLIHQPLPRPDRMALYKTRTYRMVRNGPGISFLVAPAREIEWRSSDGRELIEREVIVSYRTF